MRLRVVLTSSVVASALLLASACGVESRPERSVVRFLQALNDKDVNVMITCVDPRQERMLRAGFRIVENISRLPLRDMFEMLPGLNQIFEDQIPEDFHLSDIRVTDRTVHGEVAEVIVSLTSHVRSKGIDQPHQEKLQFQLRKFERVGWRIAGIHPAS